MLKGGHVLEHVCGHVLEHVCGHLCGHVYGHLHGHVSGCGCVSMCVRITDRIGRSLAKAS